MVDMQDVKQLAWHTNNDGGVLREENITSKAFGIYYEGGDLGKKEKVFIVTKKGGKYGKKNITDTSLGRMYLDAIGFMRIK